MQDLKKKTYVKWDVQHWYLRITYQFGGLYRKSVITRSILFYLTSKFSGAQELHNSLHYTKAEFNNFFLFIQSISKF